MKGKGVSSGALCFTKFFTKVSVLALPKMVNTVVITGYVGKDAVKKTFEGKSVLDFTVADHYFASGQKQQQWWEVALWGERGNIGQFLVKGALVTVTGVAHPNAYRTKNGDLAVSLKVSAMSVQLVKGPEHGGAGAAHHGEESTEVEGRRPPEQFGEMDADQ